VTTAGARGGGDDVRGVTKTNAPVVAPRAIRIEARRPSALVAVTWRSFVASSASSETVACVAGGVISTARPSTFTSVKGALARSASDRDSFAGEGSPVDADAAGESASAEASPGAPEAIAGAALVVSSLA